MLLLRSILFLKAVRDYRLHYQADTARPTAAKICEKFLLHWSPHEVNLEETINAEIQAEVADSPQLQQDLFLAAEGAVHMFVQFGTFELWKSSESCKRALKEAKLKDLASLSSQ